MTTPTEVPRLGHARRPSDFQARADLRVGLEKCTGQAGAGGGVQASGTGSNGLLSALLSNGSSAGHRVVKFNRPGCPTCRSQIRPRDLGCRAQFSTQPSPSLGSASGRFTARIVLRRLPRLSPRQDRVSLRAVACRCTTAVSSLEVTGSSPTRPQCSADCPAVTVIDPSSLVDWARIGHGGWGLVLWHVARESHRARSGHRDTGALGPESRAARRPGRSDAKNPRDGPSTQGRMLKRRVGGAPMSRARVSQVMHLACKLHNSREE